MPSVEPVGQSEYRSYLFREACRRLTAQRFVPMSPGQVDRGDVLLCAGAALVREAVAIQCSEREGDEFARDVVGRDAAHIRKVGARVCLDPEMLSEVIIRNDSLPDRQRLEGVISWFGRCRLLTA